MAQIGALIDLEFFERAKEFAEHTFDTLGPCNECKQKNRRINQCKNCLMILFGVAMTEASLGGPEAYRVKYEQAEDKSKEPSS